MGRVLVWGLLLSVLACVLTAVLVVWWWAVAWCCRSVGLRSVPGSRSTAVGRLLLVSIWWLSVVGRLLAILALLASAVVVVT
jgi:hypothetical protein